MSEEIAVIGVAMPTDGVEKGIKALDTLAGTGAKVEKAMDGIDKAAEKTGKSLATLGQGNGTGLSKVVADTTAAASGVKKIADAATEADAGLKKVGTTANVAAGQLGKMEVSAKQTAAALRGVPAQFTDIVTSLQGGQAPLTVLLQQGGQLKDMFGGAGNAARALAGYVAGLITPFTVVAAAVAAVGFAAYAGRKEFDEFNKALILNGNQVGSTAGGLSDMAKSISSVSGTTGAAAEALTAFAAAGAVGASGIQKATEAALGLEKFGGQAIAETVKQFKSLGEDPLRASIRLNEATNFLTAGLYKQIKALEEQGRTTEAAKLAQDAFTESSLSKVAEIQAGLGTIERGWRAITNEVKRAGDALLNIGRPESIGSQVFLAQAELSRLQRPGATVQRGLNLTSPVRDSDIAAQKEVVDLLNRQALKEQEVATSRAQQKLETDSLIAADKILDGLASKKVKMDKELVETRTVLSRAGKDEVAIQEALAAVRKKYAESKGATANEGLSDAQRSLASYVAELQKRIDKEEELTEVQKAQNQLSSLGTLGQIPQVRELVLEMAKKKDVLVAEEAATKAAVRSYNEYQNAQQKILDGYKQSADAAEKSVQKYADEESAIALAAEKNISLAEAIAEVELARVRETRAKELAKGADGATLLALQKEIEAREKISGYLGRKESREANEKAAKEAAAEWKRGWEETDRLARDVFTTWATDGSNAAQKIGDTLKKALLSAVYEATLKPVVFQIYSSITGGGGAAGATGGIANLLSGNGGGGGSGLSSLSSLFGSTGGLFGSGGIAGQFASGFSGSASAASAMMGGAPLTTAAQFGSFAGAAVPWIAGAMVLKALTDYKVESRGNGLTATIGGASGLPSGSVGRFNEFSQTSSGILSGGNTINRDWSVADQGVADYIAGNVQRITASNRAYGDALGLTTGSIENYTRSIEINTTGMDAAAQKAAIDAELARFSAEQITATYGSALTGVARDGETTAQTLQRLSTDLTGVNAMFGDLGYALYDVSVTGANAASTLANAFGGLAAAQAQLGSFYQNFYSQEEQQANVYRTVQADLANVGINLSAEQLRSASRADIRAAVDGLAGDTGTEQGAARYAAAVRAANALSGVKSAATPAPAAPGAAPLREVSQGGAISYAVSEATDSVVSAWQEAADAIISTMTDIRSSSLEVGPDSFANIKAQFAIEIAKAGSGDLAALKDLPALAKTLDSAGKANSKNAVDQALLTSYILDSLGRVSGAGYADSGLTAPNYIGSAAPSATGPTQVYVPSVYIPQSYSPASSTLTEAGLAEVFTKMEKRLEAIEKSNEKLRQMLFNATDGGEDHINSKAV